jgi:hypothetical protein
MHVLDWVEGTGGNFRASLNRLLEGTGFRVEEGCPVFPASTSDSDEVRLGKEYGGLLTPEQNQALLDWWLAKQRGANVPNWDLACPAISPDSVPGLVLVEAKANVPEFTYGEGRKSPGNAENDAQIGKAIAEAREALKAQGWDVRISRDRWYQLSNRVAFAWKLASMGIPTVLIYLGFTGDKGIKDTGDPLRDDAHWRGLVERGQDVVPPKVWNTELRVNEAPLRLLIRSMPCARNSPPKVSRAASTA